MENRTIWTEGAALRGREMASVFQKLEGSQGDLG